MSISEKLNVMIIGMGIIFLALIVLCIIIWNTGRLFKTKFVSKPAVVRPDSPVPAGGRLQVDKSGVTTGETVVTGVDEVTAAVIMATISYHLNTPLGKLRIRSIKAL